jgi:hypothetical protein
MLTTAKNEKGKMPKAFMVGIAVAIWIVFGAGCAAGSQSQSNAQPAGAAEAPSHPVVAEKAASNLPTARDIAARYHGTRFHAGNVGPVPNYIGQTSTGTFFVGKEFYMVNTFTTKKALNVWLKEWAKPDTYGLTTKWKGETWVVNKVGDSPGGNS